MNARTAESDRLVAIPWLQRRAESEQPYDYCLLPYEPVAAVAGKAPSATALALSFEFAGAHPKAWEMVSALQSTLGAGRTVWGFKLGPERELSWEFYFYKNENQHPDLEIDLIRNALSPHLKVPEVPVPVPPWLMFSLSFGEAELRAGTPAELTVYVAEGNLAYRYHEGGIELTNYYEFLHPRLDIRKVLWRMRHMVHANVGGPLLAELLPPDLVRDAHHICCASKRTSDSIYYSRIRWASLMAFLRRFGWSKALVDGLAAHAPELDYLLWDVGFDFHRSGDGLTYTKSGFYGYV